MFISLAFKILFMVSALYKRNLIQDCFFFILTPVGQTLEHLNLTPHLLKDCSIICNVHGKNNLNFKEIEPRPQTLIF